MSRVDNSSKHHLSPLLVKEASIISSGWSPVWDGRNEFVQTPGELQSWVQREFLPIPLPLLLSHPHPVLQYALWRYLASFTLKQLNWVIISEVHATVLISISILKDNFPERKETGCIFSWCCSSLCRTIMYLLSWTAHGGLLDRNTADKAFFILTPSPSPCPAACFTVLRPSIP